MKLNVTKYSAMCFFAAGSLILSTTARSASVDIGNANPFEWALLSVGGNTVTVNNDSVIRDLDENGDNLGADSRQIGIQGDGGKLQMSGVGYIGGSALLADGTELGITEDNLIEGNIYGTNLGGDPKNNTIIESAQDAKLDAAAADARLFSDLYSDLGATAVTNNSITAVTDTLSIVGDAGQNVLRLDKLELGGGEVLTLDGGGNDSSFIINILGDLKLNSGRVELTGGLTFDEVLFNVDGKVSFSGGGNSSVLAGVILALDGEVSLTPGLVQGSIIGSKITLTSGADLDTPAEIPPIPVPAAVWLFGTALIGIAEFARRRKAA